MGYRGKTVEKERARELRAQARTLQEIATELGVSRSSVSVWVREVIVRRGFFTTGIAPAHDRSPIRRFV